MISTVPDTPVRTVLDEMHPLARSAALLGETAIARLKAAHVLVVGVGGVGSWAAEALVRTGLGHITLVDDDAIAPSNINRQLPALASTVGLLKVNVLAERLRAISPECDVTPLARRYTLEDTLDLAPYEAIVDAIDSVREKAALIRAATSASKPLFSSLGAALRFDPTRVRFGRFSKVTGDALARALRNRFKRDQSWPAHDFGCVYSEEPPVASCMRGSLMPVTATFGMVLAARAIATLATAKTN